MKSKTAALLALLLAASCSPKGTTTAEPSATPPPSAVTSAASASAAVSPVAPASVSAVASASPPSAKPTTYYWSEVGVVEGTLVRKSLPWSAAAVPVVVFDHPITIQAKPGDDTPVLSGAKEAWLSYNGIDKAAVAALVGKKVTYRGTLQPAQTGHHLSNPWLDGTVTER